MNQGIFLSTLGDTRGARRSFQLAQSIRRVQRGMGPSSRKTQQSTSSSKAASQKLQKTTSKTTAKPKTTAKTKSEKKTATKTQAPNLKNKTDKSKPPSTN
jgi:hypothetical protein